MRRLELCIFVKYGHEIFVIKFYVLHQKISPICIRFFMFINMFFMNIIYSRGRIRGIRVSQLAKISTLFHDCLR